jgi:5-methyltetrahydrofolate--homocysteine methyltransferase
LLKWKEDWQKSRERLAAWWCGENIDRPAIAIFAPKSNIIKKSINIPNTFKERRTNIKYRIIKSEIDMMNTFFGGEAFPVLDTEIGPGDLALFLGAKPIFRDDTEVVWYQPVITDSNLNEPLEFNPENEWWVFFRKFIAEAVKHGKGTYLVGMPDLIEGLDTLAQLRGHERLVIDMFKRPRWVHERLREITDLYFVYYDAIYKMISDEIGGNAFSLFRIWGPGRTSKVQCDFSALISPKMFKEFVEPYLKEQCSRLDFVLYHLDGPDALKHLESILNIQEIDAIQWVPGAGEEPPESPKWIPIYKKILKAEKSLWLGIPFDNVEHAIKTLGKRRLYIITRASSEKEAKNLLSILG